MSNFKFIFSALSVALFLSCSDDGNGSQSGNIGTCNNKEYNATLYDCVKGEIIGSCRGQDYYAEYEHCENGVIVDGGEDFSPRSSNSGQGGNSTGKLTYQGQTYKTVKIGTQTWMAENLNYAVSGSKCVGASGESGTLVDNGGRCGTYGRLYDWATAMNIASTYNSSSFTAKAKHQGICPKGWHLPSDDEWITLTNYVEGPSQGDCRGCAGTRLKATSGWYTGSDYIAGTDNHGFSALPGGFGWEDGDFNFVGNFGFWWSTTEDEYNSSNVNHPYMHYDGSYVDWGNGYKTNLNSVRCVQD